MVEIHDTPPRRGTGDRDAKYARGGLGGREAVHVPASNVSSNGLTPPPAGANWPTASHHSVETQETAARDAAPPPGGSGSTTDTQPVAVSSSAVGVVPPPSDCESAAPGAYEPTAIQKSAAGHDTAGEDSKVPGGPGTTAGRTVVAQGIRCRGRHRHRTQGAQQSRDNDEADERNRIGSVPHAEDPRLTVRRRPGPPTTQAIFSTVVLDQSLSLVRA